MSVMWINSFLNAYESIQDTDNEWAILTFLSASETAKPILTILSLPSGSVAI